MGNGEVNPSLFGNGQVTKAMHSTACDCGAPHVQHRVLPVGPLTVLCAVRIALFGHKWLMICIKKRRASIWVSLIKCLGFVKQRMLSKEFRAQRISSSQAGDLCWDRIGSARGQVQGPGAHKQPSPLDCRHVSSERASTKSRLQPCCAQGIWMQRLKLE